MVSNPGNISIFCNFSHYNFMESNLTQRDIMICHFPVAGVAKFCFASFVSVTSSLNTCLFDHSKYSSNVGCLYKVTTNISKTAYLTGYRARIYK